MTATNAAYHYLGGAFDASGVYSWIRRTARPGTPVLRLTLTHPSTSFLQRVREIARCGTLTRRHDSKSGIVWRVEGEQALRLAAELNPYLLRAIPLAPPEERT